MSTIPEWTLLMRNALDVERQAENLKTEALGRRCKEWVGGLGGPRCSADADTEHTHRWEQEDMPL